MVIKKSLFFIIRNIKNLKNNIFKIVNLYLMIKLNNNIVFNFCKNKVMTIIFIIIIQSNRHAINCCAIYSVVGGFYKDFKDILLRI